ncbi:DoxX family protein [soil metagenome]|jgi:putative oxidoreductase
MKSLPQYNLRGNIIIRLMVGLVFLSEGVQKYLFPVADGAGRFMKIGVPHPQFFGPFVGAVEITCGLLIIIGLFNRLATVPLLIIIINAIYFTKLPELLDKGLWTALHDSRADFCMLMGLVFLFVYGAGKYSLDNKLFKN